MSLQDLRITSLGPPAVDRRSVLNRLQLTAVSAASALLGVPAIVVWVVWTVGLPLVVVWVGLLMLGLAVPAAQLLVRPSRAISGAVLGEDLTEDYATSAGVAVRGTWIRDKARWRDYGFLAFAASGGLLLSALPAALLVSPLVYLVLAVVEGGRLWLLLLAFGGLELVIWWLVTPALVRARALADRGILIGSRADRLERRVQEVTASRSDSVDHSSAEIRRIERDLHDGAQARIVALGMSLGMAEDLVRKDPDAAAALLREARESSVTALSDLRTVVRGILPPVLADRGLAGAIEALALDLPIPVTITLAMTGRLPDPVESALYFAVAECLANTVKHAHAARAWVSLGHDGRVAHVEVGDDGLGGADATASGLAGVARRLAAFDGTASVDSPPGGPTRVTLEVPCPMS